MHLQVLLAGGFCASAYVQQRLRDAPGKATVKVVVPGMPEAAVVNGKHD